MKYVYLAGSIMGAADPNAWREHAKSLLKPEWEGINPLDYETDSLTGAELVRLDYGLICSSNLVLVNVTDPSWGTAMELAFAKQVNLPVVAFYEGDELKGPGKSRWLGHRTNAIIKGLPGAIDFIRGTLL